MALMGTGAAKGELFAAAAGVADAALVPSNSWYLNDSKQNLRM